MGKKKTSVDKFIFKMLNKQRVMKVWGRRKFGGRMAKEGRICKDKFLPNLLCSPGMY